MDENRLDESLMDYGMPQKNNRDYQETELKRTGGDEMDHDDSDGRERIIPEKITLHDNKPIFLSAKVKVPVEENPQFNFVGKIIGPRGLTLQHLQMKTQSKVMVMGRGSMKDRDKEEDLRKNGGAKYSHLNDELHVLVQVRGTPVDAYGRMAAALSDLRMLLMPDKTDSISMGQRQLAQGIQGGMIPDSMGRGRGSFSGPPRGGRGQIRGRGQTGPTRSRGGMGGPLQRGGMSGGYSDPSIQGTPPFGRGVIHTNTFEQDTYHMDDCGFNAPVNSRQPQGFHAPADYSQTPNFTDFIGDQSWDGSKSQPPSRNLNKSYHQQSFNMRPY